MRRARRSIRGKIPILYPSFFFFFTLSRPFLSQHRNVLRAIQQRLLISLATYSRSEITRERNYCVCPRAKAARGYYLERAIGSGRRERRDRFSFTNWKSYAETRRSNELLARLFVESPSIFSTLSRARSFFFFIFFVWLLCNFLKSIPRARLERFRFSSVFFFSFLLKEKNKTNR